MAPTASHTTHCALHLVACIYASRITINIIAFWMCVCEYSWFAWSQKRKLWQIPCKQPSLWLGVQNSMPVQHPLVDPLMSLNWGPMYLELLDPTTGSREVWQCKHNPEL